MLVPFYHSFTYQLPCYIMIFFFFFWLLSHMGSIFFIVVSMILVSFFVSISFGVSILFSMVCVRICKLISKVEYSTHHLHYFASHFSIRGERMVIFIERFYFKCLQLYFLSIHAQFNIFETFYFHLKNRYRKKRENKKHTQQARRKSQGRKETHVRRKQSCQYYAHQEGGAFLNQLVLRFNM